MSVPHAVLGDFFAICMMVYIDNNLGISGGIGLLRFLLGSGAGF